MKKNAKDQKQSSLVKRLRKSLVLAVSLLILALLFRLSESIFTTVNLYTLSQQTVAIHDDLNKMLQSMTDQETGLRGYITTNNPTFLEPFTGGRPQYLLSSQDLKNKLNNRYFNDTAPMLAQVEERANDWYNNFAEAQIKNMQSGNFSIARSESTSTTGRTLFDRFRAAIGQLQQATNHDLASLQNRGNVNIWFGTTLSFLLLAIVIVLLWHRFNRFARDLAGQLNTLKNIAQQLGAGDLSVRVDKLAHEELNQLGQSFNAMADTLQQEQEAGLKERNTLESVLQLNTLLTYNLDKLDLKAIIDALLSKALTLLDLHIGALYLYDADRERLTLFAAQGADLDQVQTQFRPGEGTVGRVVVNREPLYLSRPADGEAKGFVVKSMLGIIRPSSSYYLPLVRGDELLGRSRSCL